MPDERTEVRPNDAQLMMLAGQLVDIVRVNREEDAAEAVFYWLKERIRKISSGMQQPTFIPPIVMTDDEWTDFIAGLMAGDNLLDFNV